MPPKKNNNNDKAKSAKKAQAAADKTFGLKNKNKSKKVQEYVRQVEAQTSSPAAKRAEALKKQKIAEKKAAEQARKEAELLFGTVNQQKVPFGVDPKSVLCDAFKAGRCSKGAKCKFSHDLEIVRKTTKRDLYTDDRSKEKKEADTMDKWDEEKLRQVITSKHGNPKTTTDIVCKYFIEAVENSKYGWFWTCPNGGDKCKYRHSLPEGFVLKTKEQKLAEKRAAASQPQITLEEFIETERAKLPKKLTPVTLETFTEWKKKREADKLKKEEQELKKSKTKQISGKQLLLSGKYIDDDDDGDTSNAWNMNDLKQRVDDIPEEEIREQKADEN